MFNPRWEKLAEKSNDDLLARVEILKQTGRPPKLVAILVGDDPASATYVSMKEKACEKLVKTEIKDFLLKRQLTN